jgi:hypothetical protein
MKVCGVCGEPVEPGIYHWMNDGGAVAHVVCPTSEEIARRRRLGRGSDHVAQLVSLYPAGSRGHYV